jgi:hypothetical protein
MSHNESDRRAFNETRINNEHADKVAEWLKANPEIGVLNGGQYYKIVNGQTVPVAEFEEMDKPEARATQVGNSKKEMITYGDFVVRKAVDIGKYNYLCLFRLDGQERPVIGASGTAENAAKWTPCQISVDVYLPRKSDSDESKAAAKARYQELKAKYGPGRRMSQHGVAWYRFNRRVHREVVKIERS